MGCCFSTELNSVLQGERSGLLQSPLHEGLSEVTEELRQHATAVAQHVCLDEEEASVADNHEGQKGSNSEVCTEVVIDLEPASGLEEKRTIITSTSTNFNINTDGEANMTCAVRPACVELPTLTRLSSVRQKNAAARSSWFHQLPGGPEQHKQSWSSPTRLPSADVTVGEASGDHQPLLAIFQETLQDSPKAKPEAEDSEEVHVVTTLCEEFGTKTRSFYSICSIDTDDLEHDQSQSQTAGADASPLHVVVSREEEAAPGPSSSALSQMLSADQTAIPGAVVSPQLITPPCDPLPLTSSLMNIEEPQVSTQIGSQSACLNRTDKPVEGTSMTSHTEENPCEKGSRECVSSEEIVAEQQDKDLHQSVDCDMNPQDDHLRESDLSTEQHIGSPLGPAQPPEPHISSQSPTSSKLQLKSPFLEDVVSAPPGGQIETERPCLQTEGVPVSVREEGDTAVTEGSSLSLTPLSDDKLSSDNSDGVSNNSAKELSSIQPSSQDVEPFSEAELVEEHCFHSCDMKAEIVVPPLQSYSDKHLQEVQPSQDDSQSSMYEKDVASSHLEISAVEQDLLSELHDCCTAVYANVRDGHEYAPTQPPPAEGQLPHSSFSPDTDVTESPSRQAVPLLQSFSLQECEEAEQQQCFTPQTVSKPPQSLTSVSSDHMDPEDVLLQHDGAETFHPPNGIISKENDESPSVGDDVILPETLSQTIKVQTHPIISDLISPGSNHQGVCQADLTLTSVDPGQIDAHTSTPSYVIHCCWESPVVPEEGGMKEMVSELLGEEVDSTICCRYDAPCIKPSQEKSCGGWAQETSQAELQQMGSDSEEMPALVSELQPSVALLAAYPYSTVMPQGDGVWDWLVDCPQPVSVQLGPCLMDKNTLVHGGLSTSCFHDFFICKLNNSIRNTSGAAENLTLIYLISKEDPCATVLHYVTVEHRCYDVIMVLILHG